MSSHDDSLSVAEIRALLVQAEGRRLRMLLEQHGSDTRSGVVDACGRAQARDHARRAERDRTGQMYQLERSLLATGFIAVAGVDEVGRGALAGPVSAGAVILSANDPILGLNDSKKLSPVRREELALVIHERAVAVGIGHVSASDIDALGLAAALRKAMQAALDQLEPVPDHVVIDGLPLGIHSSETAVVKGDAKVAAVAAASIVANSVPARCTDDRSAAAEETPHSSDRRVTHAEPLGFLEGSANGRMRSSSRRWS